MLICVVINGLFSMWDLGCEKHALYPRHEGGEEGGFFGGGDLFSHRITQGHELIDLDPLLEMTLVG